MEGENKGTSYKAIEINRATLTEILWDGNYYYAHFTDKQTKAQGEVDLHSLIARKGKGSGINRDPISQPRTSSHHYYCLKGCSRLVQCSQFLPPSLGHVTLPYLQLKDVEYVLLPIEVGFGHVTSYGYWAVRLYNCLYIWLVNLHSASTLA